MSHHDHSYKLLFSHPEMVRDLLLGFVHEAWVSELDFSTLERVNTSYISEDLRRREDDIVWRVRRTDAQSDGWLYIYLLMEFQSQPDPWMAMRMLVYVGLLYQELIKGRHFTKSGKLPPVFPLVLYNGEQPWKAAERTAELIEPLPGGLVDYRPDLHYLLIDENRYAGQSLPTSENLVGHAVNNVTISRTHKPQQQGARAQDWQANSSECNAAAEACGPARREAS